MLGHADLKQTSTYLNVTLSSLKESMRKSNEASTRVSDALDGCSLVASDTSTERPLARNEDVPFDANSPIH